MLRDGEFASTCRQDSSETGIETIRYLETKFICRLTSNALFSAYKGSMLRGCLGTNLGKGLCMARRNDCADCPLAENCVFPHIFKPVTTEGKSKGAPFCIEPELDEKRAYETGDTFCFNLRLFSHACEYLPFFVMAFRMADEKGIGSDQMPGTFHLDKILANGISIYDPVKDKLQIPEALPLPDPGQIPQDSSPSTLNLQILTQLRHKSQNHLASRLNFPELFHLILRRTKAPGLTHLNP